jgi:hypothetical protein
MPYPPAKELLQYLAFYDHSVEQLALATRDFVLQEMAPCVEYIVDATNAVAMGYGPTDRLKDGVCHVAVYSKYVNIGLNHGAELDNSSGLLEGADSQTRHITIRNEADLKNPAVRKCLRAAYKLAGMKETTSHLKDVSTVIKKPYPRKRRPFPAGRALAASSSRR